MNSDAPIPTDMRTEGEDHLRVEWSDGHVSLYSFQYLRGHCPCAECVDEITGARQVFPEHIPAGIRPTEAKPVGRYAYQFLWSDGHSTGLYTYTYLRELCQCEVCEKQR